MTTALRYDQGATKPDAVITCTENIDGVDTPIDLSSGYTAVVLRVGRRGQTIFEETDPAVVGTATGVTVDWTATGKLADLTPGSYLTSVVATENVTGEDRKFSGTLVVRPSLLPVS
jgi:hypothetical protein